MMPSDRGVMVGQITPDSPAAKAGLNSGDRILKIDNQDVTDANQLLQAIAAKKPGDKVTMRVASKDQEKDVQVTLGEWPNMPMMPGGDQFQPGMGAGRRPAYLGVQIQPMTPELKNQHNIKTDSGVLVAEVVPGSPAAQGGVRVNDVITKVNDKAVTDFEQLRDALRHVGPGNEATLHVARGGENVTMKVKLSDAMFGMFQNPDVRYRMPNFDSMMQPPQQRIADLERRIQELEQRIKELEGKQK
jgi:serine protease Do